MKNFTKLSVLIVTMISLIGCGLEQGDLKLEEKTKDARFSRNLASQTSSAAKKGIGNCVRGFFARCQEKKVVKETKVQSCGNNGRQTCSREVVYSGGYFNMAQCRCSFSKISTPSWSCGACKHAEVQPAELR